ncbi:MAG TPA: PilZ domain-containing protein [Tepidisphaeraceae bacterium]|nr:PilZ domain-containing protein [Tepidisphaeraceae bacterium]
MSLTYDQKSEIRLAFDEAFIPAERRRDTRVKYKASAEITTWKRGKEGLPFRVQIEDFSPGGVGLTHGSALPEGTQYVLKVPRPELAELNILLTVVRCVPQEDGSYLVGLELSSVLDRASFGEFVDDLDKRQRRTSRRTKILLLLLGIFGVGTSLLIR